MVTVAFGGEETVWGLGFKLCGDLKPWAFNPDGCQRERCHSPDHAIDRGEDGAGIQPKEESKESLGEKGHREKSIT